MHRKRFLVVLALVVFCLIAANCGGNAAPAAPTAAPVAVGFTPQPVCKVPNVVGLDQAAAEECSFNLVYSRSRATCSMQVWRPEPLSVRNQQPTHVLSHAKVTSMLLLASVHLLCQQRPQLQRVLKFLTQHAGTTYTDAHKHPRPANGHANSGSPVVFG